MNAQAILNKLESLEAKATQGKCRQDELCKQIVWIGDNFDTIEIDTKKRDEDAALFVAMRNAIKPLIAALRFEMETSQVLANGMTLPHGYLQDRRAELNAILSDVELNEGGR